MRVHEPSTIDAADPILVARQVIMDRNRQVFAYELLYRQASAAAESTSGQVATARILCDAITAIGFDVLTDSRLAFISIDRQTLLAGVPTLLPGNRLAFQFGTDITPTAEILAACRDLQAQGFALAFEAHADLQLTAEFLPVAAYLRVDGSRPDLDRDALETLLRSAPHKVVPIATHIETQKQFGRALDLGFELFQGFFFGEPVVKEGRAIPGPQLTRLKLVQSLQDPRLGVDDIEALIKPDAALCYRTLRAVNAAGLAHRTAVKSIREALVLVGREPIRRWAALLAFAESSRHAPSELLALSAIRARFCELLAERRQAPIDPAEAFLVGLCSLLDAILNRPMDEILRDLPLPEDVCDALRGQDNPLQQLLACATAYGSGEWERATAIAEAAGVKHEGLQKLYVQALKWARELKV